MDYDSINSIDDVKIEDLQYPFTPKEFVQQIAPDGIQKFYIQPLYITMIKEGLQKFDALKHNHTFKPKPDGILAKFIHHVKKKTSISIILICFYALIVYVMFQVISGEWTQSNLIESFSDLHWGFHLFFAILSPVALLLTLFVWFGRNTKSLFTRLWKAEYTLSKLAQNTQKRISMF